MINLNGIYSRDLLKNNRTRMALAILSGTKCPRGNRDSYVRNTSREADYSTYDKYSVTIRVITKGEYTPEILDLINFHYDDICRNKGNRVDDYIIGCKKYMKNEIPTIDPCRCGDIKAIDNTVTFDEGKYYKYIDKTGYTHIFACTKNYLGQPQSDLDAHRQNKSTYNIGLFWRMLAQNQPGCGNATGLGMHFSREEQIQFLNDAGIKNGFFKVYIGERRQENFLTQCMTVGPVIPKKQYDDYYKQLTQPGISLKNHYFSPGDTIKIGTKEYTMKDDYSIDIPYGEDIYMIEYPKYQKNRVICDENSMIRLVPA